MKIFLLLLLFWATFRPVGETLWLAFIGGLVFSLLRGELLGLFSFWFLLGSGLVLLYRRRFDSWHLAFLPFFVFWIFLFFDRLVNGFWGWSEAFVFSFFALLLSFFSRRFGHDFKKQISFFS